MANQEFQVNYTCTSEYGITFFLDSEGLQPAAGVADNWVKDGKLGKGYLGLNITVKGLVVRSGYISHDPEEAEKEVKLYLCNMMGYPSVVSYDKSETTEAVRVFDVQVTVGNKFKVFITNAKQNQQKSCYPDLWSR